MNRINQILLVLFLVAAFSGYTFAQTIVILNGVPTKVQLEGDRIVAVLEEVPNYLAGYQNRPTQIQYGNEGNVVSGAIASASSPSTPVTAAPVASQPANTAATNMAASNAVTNLPTSNAATAFAGNYFKFSGNSALLSELSINEIKDYAKKISKGEATSVTLESFYRANSKRSEQLINNRLNACKKYFELSGVAPNLITINKIADKNQSNKVAVTLN